VTRTPLATISSTAGPTTNATITGVVSDITANPLPTGDVEDTSTPDTAAEHSGFARGGQPAIIAASVIGKERHRAARCALTRLLTVDKGAVLIITFLIYALRRKRRGATTSEILRFRPHSCAVVMPPTTPRKDKFNDLPIFFDWRFSIRSSKHVSMAYPAKPSGRASSGMPPPPPGASRFREQNSSVKDTWKTSSPVVPSQSGKGALSSHPPPPPLKKPDAARVRERRLSSHSSTSNDDDDDDAPRGPRTSMGETWPLVADPNAPMKPARHAPDTWYGSVVKQSQNAALDLTLSIRSWTNTDAPRTPHMYAQFRHASRSSLPRFRISKARAASFTPGVIDEEAQFTVSGRRSTGRSQSSTPSLPRHSSMGHPGGAKHTRGSSIFRHHPGTKVGSFMSSRTTEEQRPPAEPQIEMTEASGRSSDLGK